MVKFCDLPLEILLDIIDRATESTKDPPPSHPHGDDSIRCLSLVCSYLNGVTARKLFRTYRLQLREKDSDDDSAEGAEGAGAPTCFLTGRSLLELHPDGVEARLGHLRKKAAFVRELRIVDYGQPAVYRTGSSAAYLKERDGPPPAAPFDLPPLVVRPALIETLDTLDRVVSVVFETTDMSRPPARLPDELWGWLSRCKPRKVSFDGYFAFPDPLGWLPPVVGSMSLVMNEEASRVLEVVRPAHLDIRVDTADRSENTFKEIFEPYPTLEQLDIRFQYYDDCLPRGYFDFTAHPETGISIHMVVSDVDLYIEDPGAWETTEESLKEIFVDDFPKLDVRRDVASDTLVISRPLPGQKGGVRALNLPKNDHDDVDEENRETVLAFEQAVLAALPESEPESDRGPLAAGPIIDAAAFWVNLDGVFATVYSQTFEALVQSVSVPSDASSVESF